KRWTIGGRPYTPVDISALILKSLLASAREQIGEIDQAVVTVPAQFSEAQRLATIEAGHRAGLNRVDLINEPVAAALCYVLGAEGLWFSELAEEQRVMVFDLGGGTFDLSLVKYSRNEVAVIASDGDLHLGGLDWNMALLNAIAEQFRKEFRLDPRHDPESLQFLTNEVEQTKRSLSVRPKAALTCQHAGHRKTYQVEQSQFEKLTRHLVDRTEEITKRLLRDRKMGWAHVDVVLTTGGASRMPMIRDRLKQLSGRTLNTSLSPDLSIAHGATYYAGMLLSNDKFARSILRAEASERLSRVKQRSVNARGLGILVRDPQTNTRVPHYLIPPNTPLPAEVTQKFGTVVENQTRVRLVVVESGAGPDEPFV
ncbi:MAG TPA: Hsp70 family protein, partial [Planctomycetaceae bacterium]